MRIARKGLSVATMGLVLAAGVGLTLKSASAQDEGGRPRGDRPQGGPGRDRGEPGDEERGFRRGGPGGPGGFRGGPGGPGGPRFEEMMKLMPLFAALDLDEDGKLSAAEIKKASKSLAKLDKNEDGEIGEEEMRPDIRAIMEKMGGGPGGPFGPPGAGDRRGPPGEGGGRPPRDGQGDRGGNPEMVAQMVQRMMQMDKNGDDKLSKDELPERMAGAFGRIDEDGDGFLSKSELETMAKTRGARGGRRPDGAGQGRGRPDGDGGSAGGEIPKRPKSDK